MRIFITASSAARLWNSEKINRAAEKSAAFCVKSISAFAMQKGSRERGLNLIKIKQHLWMLSLKPPAALDRDFWLSPIMDTRYWLWFDILWQPEPFSGFIDHMKEALFLLRNRAFL